METHEERTITTVATQIAGSIFAAAYGSLPSRLNQVISCHDPDCSLSSTDRDRLRLLLDAATGITSDLTDSKTCNIIRPATVDEACASALAGPEGHIAADGRTCYVAL